MYEVKPDSAETEALLARVQACDATALGQLLERHRPALLAFVEARLDPRLKARMDPSDVVQEAQIEVSRKIDQYLQSRPMPFHIWVRRIAYQRTLNAARDHRDTGRRSVKREVPLPDRSSMLLVKGVLARDTSPSQRMQAREFAERVSLAVAELSGSDREILLMRQVEQLPYDEIALLLDTEPATARKRYGRALVRLHRVLAAHGLLGELS